MRIEMNNSLVQIKTVRPTKQIKTTKDRSVLVTNASGDHSFIDFITPPNQKWNKTHLERKFYKNRKII